MIVNQTNSEISVIHPFVESASIAWLESSTKASNARQTEASNPVQTEESNPVQTEGSNAMQTKTELVVAYKKFASVIEKQLAEYNMLQSQNDNSRFINKIYYEYLKQINMIWLNELAIRYAHLIDRDKLMQEITTYIADIDVLYIGRCIHKTYLTTGTDNALLSLIVNLKKSWCTTPKLKADINEIIEALGIQDYELNLEINLLHKWVARKEYYISSLEYQFMLIGFSANEINRLIQMKDIKFTIVHNDLCDDYWLWRGNCGYFKTTAESNLSGLFRGQFMLDIDPYSFSELLLGIDGDIFEYCMDQLENFNEITTNDIGYFIILNFIAMFHDIKTPIKLDMKCGHCPLAMKYMGTLPVCQKCQNKYICYRKPFRTWLYEGMFDVFCVMLNPNTCRYFDDQAFNKFINLKCRPGNSVSEAKQSDSVSREAQHIDSDSQPNNQTQNADEPTKSEIFTVDQILEEYDVNPTFDFR